MFSEFLIDALEVEEVPEDETALIQLLESIDLSRKVIDCFLVNQYSIQTLKLIERQEVEELIPYPFLAERTKFIFHLNNWRKEQNLPTLADKSNVHNQVQIERREIPREKCTAAFLLNESAKSQSIIKRYTETTFLTRSDKKVITHVIVDEFKDRFGRLTPFELQLRATELGNIFPSEPQETWYQPTSSKDSSGNKIKLRKQAKGRLHDRNLNYKSVIRVCESTAQQQVQPSECNSPAVSKAQLTEYQQVKSWLVHNQDEWEEVRRKWKLYSVVRCLELAKLETKTCASVLNELPTLRNHQGYQLIQLDFQERYPGKDTLLFNRWSRFVDAIRPILYVEVTDSEVRSLLALLNSDNINGDARDAIVVSLIAHIFPSPILILPEKVRWKPSIQESKESVFVYVPNLSCLEATVPELFDAWRIKGVPAAPFIVVFGESETNLTDFILWNDTVSYKFLNFLKALDICIKFYKAYEIDFPRQSRATWTFLSECLFDFTCSSDLANVKALRLAIGNRIYEK
ncbi:uncharacterized protein LOC129718374 isoform X2 [Wyeomyia smithii]|uniref:uncharacterized protein LOC129718374 isoform X2 n=1 Tax=Wyeomyia smithii TaxID=174621 RepID=UPI0024680F75|nr:uncharacterized protein LOC129718374 isoform X2 [Wyeomyia smithii]